MSEEIYEYFEDIWQYNDTYYWSKKNNSSYTNHLTGFPVVMGTGDWTSVWRRAIFADTKFGYEIFNFLVTKSIKTRKWRPACWIKTYKVAINVNVIQYETAK
jgi:hypothetical protein